MSKNPTALTLLKRGWTLESPCGYCLSGRPKDGDIRLSHQFGSDGIRNLTREGLAEALNDARKYEKENEE